MFSCEFAKSLRTPFLQNTTRLLLLIIAVSIVLVMKGELASESVNYDTKTMYQFEPKCNLTRRTLHVKQQVSEAVVHRLQFLKFRKLHRKISVFEPLGLQLYQKETSIQLFSCEIYKISKNTCFMEQLQWLLLRFNSCFQRSPQFS